MLPSADRAHASLPNMQAVIHHLIHGLALRVQTFQSQRSTQPSILLDMVDQPPTHPSTERLYPSLAKTKAATTHVLRDLPNPNLIDQTSQGNGNSARDPAIHLRPRQDANLASHGHGISDTRTTHTQVFCFF